MIEMQERIQPSANKWRKGGKEAMSKLTLGTMDGQSVSETELLVLFVTVRSPDADAVVDSA